MCATVQPMAPTRAELDEARAAALREAIIAALRKHGGNRTAAAAELEYSTGGALSRAASRVGLNLAALIPAPKPSEYGGWRTGAAKAKAKREAEKPRAKKAATKPRRAKP